MVLSKREKYIAIGVGAAVGLLVLDSLIFAPYFTRRNKITVDRTALNEQTEAAAATLMRQSKLRPVWAEIQQHGLMVDPDVAASQAQKAILDWAHAANVELFSLRNERPAQEGQFQIINFGVTGTGTMNSISKFLWSLETAAIPIRVNDMQITPRREGTDDLSIRLTVSALCMTPTAADKVLAEKAAAKTLEDGL